MPPDVGLAPSRAWRPSFSTPPCDPGPLPHTLSRPLPEHLKKSQGVGGEEGGKGRGFREGSSRPSAPIWEPPFSCESWLAFLILEPRIGKELAPYRIGKHSNPQNRAKIHQKYTKNRGFRVFLVYFCPILLVGTFSYSLGGQLFPEPRSLPVISCGFLPRAPPKTTFHAGKCIFSAGKCFFFFSAGKLQWGDRGGGPFKEQLGPEPHLGALDLLGGWGGEGPEPWSSIPWCLCKNQG